MINLALAAAFFVIIHIGVSGSALRGQIVGRTGLGAYMGLYSVVSLAGMIWLVSAYKDAPYAPTWGALEWWKPFQIALMLPAALLVVVGLVTPNPTAVAQEGLVGRPVRGIVRITRHPFLVGVAIWAGVHLVGNGDWASFLFFLSLLVVAVAGPASIDAKRRVSVGAAAWDGFARQTSIIPFAAILAKRNTLVAHEFGWWRPAAGLAIFALMLGGHAHIVGVSPWPQ